MNMGRQLHTSSNYKSVYYENKWTNGVLALCLLEQANNSVVCSTAKEEAAAKSNKEAIQLFGEHACLSQVSCGEEDGETEDVDECRDV